MTPAHFPKRTELRTVDLHVPYLSACTKRSASRGKGQKCTGLPFSSLNVVMIWAQDCLNNVKWVGIAYSSMWDFI